MRTSTYPASALPGMGRKTRQRLFIVGFAALLAGGAGTVALTGERALQGLRGSGDVTRAVQTGSHMPTGLRGRVDDLATGSVVRLGDAFLLGGSLRPSDDRHGQLGVADRPVLRRSMAHAANLTDGLRLETASVGDSVAQTLRGSHAVRAALSRTDASHARKRVAVGAFLPKVSVEIDHGTGTSYDGAIDAGDVHYDTSKVSVGLSMPVFTSGALLNGYRAARSRAVAADYGYLVAEHRTAMDAIVAHLNLRLNRAVERTLADNVAAVSRIADIARRRFDAGDASRTDIAIADANVEAARSEHDLARKMREELATDYESLTGRPVPKRLSAPSVAHYVPDSIDAAVELAQARNPALAAAWLDADAGAYDAKAVRGRFGPQASLYGNYSSELHHSARDTQNGWTFGARLTVPLVDFTAMPSIAAARHDALQAGYMAQDTARMLTQQVRKQWTAYHSARRRVAIVERQIAAVERTVTGTRREYEAGFRSITDVLDVQMTLARARISLEQTRHEEWQAAYALAFTTVHPAIDGLMAKH